MASLCDGELALARFGTPARPWSVLEGELLRDAKATSTRTTGGARKWRRYLVWPPEAMKPTMADGGGYRKSRRRP